MGDPRFGSSIDCEKMCGTLSDPGKSFRRAAIVQAGHRIAHPGDGADRTFEPCLDIGGDGVGGGDGAGDDPARGLRPCPWRSVRASSRSGSSRCRSARPALRARRSWRTGIGDGLPASPGELRFDTNPSADAGGRASGKGPLAFHIGREERCCRRRAGFVAAWHGKPSPRATGGEGRGYQKLGCICGAAILPACAWRAKMSRISDSEKRCA